MMGKRERCGGCDGCRLETVLDLGSTPLADDYGLTPVDVKPRYPLTMVVCADCSLAQLGYVVDHAELFRSDYAFRSGAHPAMAAYQRDYARWLIDTGLVGSGDALVVEVACNDGSLARHLVGHARTVVGIDPATEALEEARATGVRTIAAAFTANIARDVVGQWGRAGLIVANNVVAHVSDLNDLFDAFTIVLAEEGRLVVEVQYVGDLLLANAFDLAYHEHRFFFSLSSLEAIAARWGLELIWARPTDRQGGSMRAIFARPGRYEVDARTLERVTGEAWLRDMCAYTDLGYRARRVLERTWDLISQVRAEGRRLVGYGAPAKASTMIHTLGLDVETMCAIVDTTPTKQGLFIPGTGIPIIAPGEEPPDIAYLAFIWNYLSPITRDMPNAPIIVPLPTPVIL